MQAQPVMQAAGMLSGFPASPLPDEKSHRFPPLQPD
jgi:hypothetical protein